MKEKKREAVKKVKGISLKAPGSRRARRSLGRTRTRMTERERMKPARTMKPITRVVQAKPM